MVAPNSTASTETLEHLRSSLEYQTRLNRITERIHEAESFADVMPEILPDLLSLLNAERLTIYQRAPNGREIVSKLKLRDSINEIRVPLSPTSISGYCALAQKVLRIEDVYDKDELKQIHPQLNFDQSFDKKSGFRSRSMLVVPIKQKTVLLGVIQVINRIDKKPFSDADLNNTIRLAQLIAQKFRYELQISQGPYDYLLVLNKLTESQLEGYRQRAKTEKVPLERLLISEHGILPAEVGASLAHYYQIPFMPYDPKVNIPKHFLQGINGNYLRNQYWVPVAGDRQEVTVLIDDPTDTERMMEIQNILRAQNYGSLAFPVISVHL